MHKLYFFKYKKREEKQNKRKISQNLIINTFTRTNTYSKTTYRNFSQIKLENKSMESNEKKQTYNETNRNRKKFKD